MFGHPTLSTKVNPDTLPDDDPPLPSPSPPSPPLEPDDDRTSPPPHTPSRIDHLTHDFSQQSLRSSATTTTAIRRRPKSLEPRHRSRVSVASHLQPQHQPGSGPGPGFLTRVAAPSHERLSEAQHTPSPSREDDAQEEEEVRPGAYNTYAYAHARNGRRHVHHKYHRHRQGPPLAQRTQDRPRDSNSASGVIAKRELAPTPPIASTPATTTTVTSAFTDSDASIFPTPPTIPQGGTTSSFLASIAASTFPPSPPSSGSRSVPDDMMDLDTVLEVDADWASSFMPRKDDSSYSYNRDHDHAPCDDTAASMPSASSSSSSWVDALAAMRSGVRKPSWSTPTSTSLSAAAAAGRLKYRTSAEAAQQCRNGRKKAPRMRRRPAAARANAFVSAPATDGAAVEAAPVPATITSTAVLSEPQGQAT